MADQKIVVRYIGRAHRKNAKKCYSITERIDKNHKVKYCKFLRIVDYLESINIKS